MCRRLGYGYAFVDGHVRRLVEVPEASPGWEVDDAGPDDAEAIAAQYARAGSVNDIVLLHDVAAWRWMLAGAPTWGERVRVARRDGRVHGLARTQVRREERYWATWGTAESHGAATALLADAAALAPDDLKGYLIDRHADAWGSVAERAAAHDPASFEAVYARIPDPVGFLDAIRPVLSERLAASPVAEDTGELTVSLYEDGFVIAYERGEVTEVRRDPEPAVDPLDDDAAGVPPDVFPALAFGRFPATELEVRYDDVGFVKDRALVAALFPQQHVDLIAPI